MIKANLSVLNAVERGIKPSYKVRIYLQEPEDYTVNDYLLSVGRISASLSSEGGYAIANTTVSLKNKDRYFSIKFARELPVKRLVEIYMLLDGNEILRFRGVVGSWKYSKRTDIELTVNA